MKTLPINSSHVSAPSNTPVLPGRPLSGVELHTAARVVMLHCLGREFLRMCFQPPMWCEWSNRGGDLTMLSPDRAIAVLNGHPSWLVVNQQTEQVSEATLAEVISFIPKLTRSRHDWVFFEPTTGRAMAFTHDDQWFELTGDPDTDETRAALPTLLEAFDRWADVAARDHDGWQSSFPQWPSLIKSATAVMRKLAAGDPDSVDVQAVARVWSLSEETEDLADFTRADPTRFAPILPALFHAGDPNTRYQIAAIAGAFPRLAGATLKLALADPDPYVRRRAFIALIESDPETARLYALRFVNDEDLVLANAARPFLGVPLRLPGAEGRPAIDTVRDRFRGEHFEPDTPLPGRPSTPAERETAFRIIASHLASPREAALHITPLYCHFGPRLAAIQGPLPVDAPEVFIAVERTPLCNTARGQDVQQYLARKQPWEDYDIYIIDPRHPNLCLCITHDDAPYLSRLP